MSPLCYPAIPHPFKTCGNATAPFLMEAEMVSSFPHFFFARELCVRFDRIAESVHSGRTGNFSPLADLSPPSTTLAAFPLGGTRAISFRHSARRKEECLLAGAFRRSGARAPTGRSTDMGGMPARRSIPPKRRTSPMRAKYYEPKASVRNPLALYSFPRDSSSRSLLGMTRNSALPAPLTREERVRLFKVREGSGLFSESPFADATNVCVYALPSIPHLRGTAIIF